MRSASIALPSNSEIEIGSMGEQLKATLDFLRVAFEPHLVLVDAPAEKHFTIMPSDLNEITNPGLRLSAFARSRCSRLHDRQNGGVAFQLRLQRRRNRRGRVERARRLAQADEGSACRFQ